VLANIDSEKYLGITIDYRLNFEGQIILLTAKISRSIGDYAFYINFGIPSL